MDTNEHEWNGPINNAMSGLNSCSFVSIRGCCGSFSRALVIAIIAVAACASAAAGLPRTNLLCYARPDGSVATVATTADWQRRRAQILEAFQKIAGPLP